MRTPEVLASLVDEGIIEDVLRPLMSGKEAQVYLVASGGREFVAKVYKDADTRSFKHRSSYTEGRKVRNTRDQRAIDKRSRHGRTQDEAAWRSAEVDAIYRLRAAGVRVPAPHHFIDGVLIMELVLGADGTPAPRLADASITRDQARAIYGQLIQETTRMLCAGVVHGDLSEFNVLLAADGPVIIDFPQSVDPAKNPNARRLLLRDVENLHRFLARYVPECRRVPYAEEMWALYESNQLKPDTELRGQYRDTRKAADTGALLALLDEERRDGAARHRHQEARPAARSTQPSPQRRVEVIVPKSGPGRHRSAKPQRVEVIVRKSSTVSSPPPRSPERPASGERQTPSASPPENQGGAASASSKRRRRRRRRAPASSSPNNSSSSAS